VNIKTIYYNQEVLTVRTLFLFQNAKTRPHGTGFGGSAASTNYSTACTISLAYTRMGLRRRNPPASPTGMTPVPDQKIGTKKNPAEAG